MKTHMKLQVLNKNVQNKKPYTKKSTINACLMEPEGTLYTEAAPKQTIFD